MITGYVISENNIDASRSYSAVVMETHSADGITFFFCFLANEKMTLLISQYWKMDIFIAQNKCGPILFSAIILMHDY